MARPKTPEEMLAAMLGNSDYGPTTGPVGGAPPPAGGAGPAESLQARTPRPSGPGYEGGWATTAPVGTPSALPELPKLPTTGYSGPAMGTGPVSPDPWGKALNPAQPPLAGPTTGPVGPIDPGAPGYSGPPATTAPVGDPSGQKPIGPAYAGPMAPTAPVTPKTGQPGYEGPAAPASPVGPKTGQPGLDLTGALSNALTAPAQTNTGQRYTSRDVAALIKELTGEDPAPGDANQWGDNIDATYFAAIRRAIEATPKAQEYARRQQAPTAPEAPAAPPPAGAGGDANWLVTDFSNPDNVRRYFNSRGANAPDDLVNYWAGKYNSPEFARDRQYFLSRLSTDPIFGGGTAGGEFNDPWGRALEDQTGQYGAAARERAAALAKTLRDRAAELNKPAYTTGDEAVLRAKAFDQLERRRQETLKNGRESVYARGFAPTSGLVQDTQNKTNQNFEQARSGIESNLLQSSLDETQRRKDSAIQLEQLATNALNGGDLSAIQALSGPLGLMNTRQQTAGSLLNNSNSQSMNAIMQILALLQQQQGYNNGQAGSQMGGIGALLPIILGALGGS